MRRLILASLFFLLAACQSMPFTAPPVEEAATAIWTASPTASPSPLPTVPALPHGWQVRTHPGEVLFAGDAVSFEVFTTQAAITETRSVTVSLAGSPPTVIGSADFGGFGIGNRRQATLTWAWDTAGLTPGLYDVVFTVQPAGPVFTQTLALQPAEALPGLQAGAQWVAAQSACCVVHYVSHTDAERDLPALLAMIDEQAASTAGRMGVSFSEPVEITLLPRLLGHGGFADSSIHVSYLDRNPAGGQAAMVIHHELVHILDYRLGGDLRPSLLVEGLAVYVSGGHFKPEPLLPRAAALLAQYGSPAARGLDRYIPLRELADAFYTSQHEIGYLQAGALVEFMVERWGWEAFNRFYRDIHPVQNAGRDGGQAAALEQGLVRHFNLTIEALEKEFLGVLHAQPANPFWREDVRLTVLHFDTLRRYQQALDPSGYFLTAWLVDEAEMRERGITADYLRRSEGPLNVTMELLLGSASSALNEGRLDEADVVLGKVNAVLDAVAAGAKYPAAVDGLAFAVYERVGWLERRGLSPQTLSVEGEWLVMGVRSDGVVLQILHLPRRW